MKKLIKLFNKVGGKEILKQYMRAHVLLFSFVNLIVIGFSKKSLEIVRNSVNNRILHKLRKKYKHFITDYLNKNKSNLNHEKSDKVWVCWLQGMDDAPILVKKCYESLKTNLYDKEIMLLTEENYRNYVKFPKHIQKKINSGIITRTHMSDLLRLELLNKHGGTWIDATVYCSGNKIPEYMLNSDLFLFQDLKPGLDGHCTRISSWFITACSNHPILLLTQEMLYDYWKNHNNMIDYFLLHDFFELAIETYPNEWRKVIPFSSSTPHILLLRLFDKYNDETWNAIKDSCCFHKLTYKFTSENTNIENSYYDKIIKKNYLEKGDFSDAN